MLQKKMYLLAMSFFVGINVYASNQQLPSKFVQKMQNAVAINVESSSKFAQKMRNNKAVTQDELEESLLAVQKSKTRFASHIRTLQEIRATRAPLQLPVSVAKDDFPSPSDIPLSAINNEVLSHCNGNKAGFSIE